jgi:ferric-dicitrate binding protein FerR (iron transport regulator)
VNDHDRLKAEIKEELLHARDVKGWLSSLPQPDSRAIARARADARTLAGEPPHASLVPRLAGAAALACIALLAWQLGPLHEAQPTPRAVAVELVPSAEPTLAGPGVVLTPNGVGTVSGTEKNVVIDWRSGDLGVSVEHGAGIALTVHTREADVRVVGTVFEVDRDVRGTRVRVTRGKVAVQCSGGGDSFLVVPGVDVTCMPLSAAGNLASARSLVGGAAPADEVLAAIDRGLGFSAPGDPVRDELQALRIETLANDGQREAAIAAARAFLATGATLRRAEVARILLRLDYEVEGCAAATPLVLGELATSPEDAQLLRACGALP